MFVKYLVKLINHHPPCLTLFQSAQISANIKKKELLEAMILEIDSGILSCRWNFILTGNFKVKDSNTLPCV